MGEAYWYAGCCDSRCIFDGREREQGAAVRSGLLQRGEHTRPVHLVVDDGIADGRQPQNLGAFLLYLVIPRDLDLYDALDLGLQSGDLVLRVVHLEEAISARVRPSPQRSAAPTMTKVRSTCLRLRPRMTSGGSRSSSFTSFGPGRRQTDDDGDRGVEASDFVSGQAKPRAVESARGAAVNTGRRSCCCSCSAKP